jgi:hypothetical protein
VTSEGATPGPSIRCCDAEFARLGMFHKVSSGGMEQMRRTLASDEGESWFELEISTVEIGRGDTCKRLERDDMSTSRAFAGKSVVDVTAGVTLCGVTPSICSCDVELGAFETSSDGVGRAAKGEGIDMTSDGVTLSIRSCQCDVMRALETSRGTGTREKNSEFADDSDGFNAMSTGDGKTLVLNDHQAGGAATRG